MAECARSCSMSPSGQAQLKEMEMKLETAAQYGLTLLNENHELTQNLADTNNKYTRQVEVSHDVCGT